MLRMGRLARIQIAIVLRNEINIVKNNAGDVQCLLLLEIADAGVV